MVVHMDDFGRILNSAVDAVRNAISQSEIEQAAHGADARSEQDFHNFLAAAFCASGIGTYPEQPFPGEVGFHLRESARERCDFALTMDGQPLRDPQQELLQRLEAKSTLFSSVNLGDSGADPEDAVWIEVKVIRRFVAGRHAPGPNRAYGTEMARAVRDLHKLHKDTCIRRAALLLILFSESDDIATRDIRDTVRLAIKEGLFPKEPRFESLAIPDRIGNAFAHVILLPIMT